MKATSVSSDERWLMYVPIVFRWNCKRKTNMSQPPPPSIPYMSRDKRPKERSIADPEHGFLSYIVSLWTHLETVLVPMPRDVMIGDVPPHQEVAGEHGAADEAGEEDRILQLR
jgi:hypothetical protein